MEEPDLSLEIAGIKMRNPIMPASGTFGYGEEYSQFFDISVLGAVVTKGTTLLPRDGNPPPRLIETKAGIINFIGLQNPGVDAVIERKIPFLRKYATVIIVNIAGHTISEYVKIAKRLNFVEGVHALEINVSCPNVDKGGMAFGQDPRTTFSIVQQVKKATCLPLIVKLTPNVTDIAEIARSAVDAGAQAISLINTVKSRAKIRIGEHAEKWVVGGLSGPAIKPIALQKVFEVSQANLGVDIIGIGGISNLEDVLDFFEVGAKAVQIGTLNFIKPCIMPEIIEGLRVHLKEEGLKNLLELMEKKKFTPLEKFFR